MVFLFAIYVIGFEQFQEGFDPEDPFFFSLWAECLDCSGYIGGYASKRKYLVVCGQCSLVSGGGKGSP